MSRKFLHTYVIAVAYIPSLAERRTGPAAGDVVLCTSLQAAWRPRFSGAGSSTVLKKVALGLPAVVSVSVWDDFFSTEVR